MESVYSLQRGKEAQAHISGRLDCATQPYQRRAKTMAPQLMLAETDGGLSLATAILPAIVTGVLAYFAARYKFVDEIKKIHLQLAHQQAAQVAALRLRYVNILRYFADTLSKRLEEIEVKFAASEYGDVQGWFQTMKKHADGTGPRGDFPHWCYYEGIFATSTLYYVCSYFQCAREVRFRSPFSEIDPTFANTLVENITRVSDAFTWIDECENRRESKSKGIWHPSQDVIGERFTKGEAKMEYEELCRIIDSQDKFQYAPFLRVMDVFIGELAAEHAKGIRLELISLVATIDARLPPANAVFVIPKKPVSA